MVKTTDSLSAEKRDRLKPALYEEVRRLCDLEPASSEYIFGENMNAILMLAKKNLQIVTGLGKNKIKEQSSRTIAMGKF